MNVNFNNTMSVNDINDLIASQAREIPPGQILLFQFADGLYTIDKTILFSGFYGGGTLIIQGNTGEANAQTTHTTQQVSLDASAASVTAIKIAGCHVGHLMQSNMKIKIDSVASGRIGIELYHSFYAYVLWNYILANGDTYGHCIQATASGILVAKQNVVGKASYGLSSLQCPMLVSDGNISNGTSDRPKYGLHAKYGGVVAMVDPDVQPTGSVGATRIESGGEIR